MTTFGDNEKLIYTIQLTGKQIREFLSNVEQNDIPDFIWFEEILKKAVQSERKKRSKK
jgi:hypothetical protein